MPLFLCLSNIFDNRIQTPWDELGQYFYFWDVWFIKVERLALCPPLRVVTNATRSRTPSLLLTSVACLGSHCSMTLAVSAQSPLGKLHGLSLIWHLSFRLWQPLSPVPGPPQVHTLRRAISSLQSPVCSGMCERILCRPRRTQMHR